MRVMCLIASAILVCAHAGAVDAATIFVPIDQPTIQAAIDVAVPGDTVRVSAGVYVETINFKGKAITVTSESGPALTTIDAGGAGPVARFESGEPRDAILAGFTLRGGISWEGAGVRISSSSPTIRGNVIRDNAGCTGVGIYSYFSSPLIENNTVAGNLVSGCSGGMGAGVYVGGNSTAEIVGNRIRSNGGADVTGAGITLFAAGRATLVSNVIIGNSTRIGGGSGWGGGLAIFNFVDARIVNNVIVQNDAGTGGAVYWINPFGSGATFFVNNTIADNTAATYPGILASGVGRENGFINNVIASGSGPSLRCEATNWAPNGPSLDSNDVFAAASAPYSGSCTDQTGIAGNISVDPGFIDPPAGDYSIGPASPMVDAGLNSAPFLPPTDVAGNPRISSAAGSPDRIDIGAYEFFSLNQPPSANAGTDQTVTAGAACTASVILHGSGYDPEGDPLTFQWSGPFGTVSGATPTVALPVGTHTITLTVTDAQGGQGTDTVVVIVQDMTPPEIGSVVATPSVITKTNHEMVPVTVSAMATDGCGGSVICQIVSVTSNEPIAGTGGGDQSPDWEITGSLTLLLRAERSPKGNGRTYTITVRCTDASGNSSTRTVTVAVPRK